MQITLVSCPNGMGHFKRLLNLALYLKKKKINLVCTKKQKKKFYKKTSSNIKLKPILKEINLKSNPFPKLLKFYNEDFSNYDFVRNSDVIISDNIINKSFYTKNFFMISNFFWSEVDSIYSHSKKKYLKIENDFIKKNFFFTNKYFCTKKANKYGKKLNFVSDDFHLKNFSSSNRKNILVYLGSNEKINKNFYLSLKRLNYIVFTNNEKLIKIGFKRFDFSTDSFSKLKYIFAKAGLGSITDSIKHKVPLIVLRNKKNLEYENNLKKILKYNIGSYIEKDLSFTNIQKEIDFIDKKRYSKFLKSFNKFKFNGSEKIKKFINIYEK
jgi:hypothetical protein